MHESQRKSLDEFLQYLRDESLKKLVFVRLFSMGSSEQFLKKSLVDFQQKCLNEFLKGTLDNFQKQPLVEFEKKSLKRNPRRKF